MGLFSKKNKDTYDDYSDDQLLIFEDGIIPIGMRTDVNHAPHALTADEVKGNEPMEAVDDIPMHSAGESLYQRMIDSRKEEKDEADKKSDETKEQAQSLLSRCSQYVEDKASVVSEPVYKLDSIEDIIAEAERRAQERVQKIYGGEEKKPEIKTEEIKEEKTEDIKPESREIVSHETAPALEAEEVLAVEEEIETTVDTDIDATQIIDFSNNPVSPPEEITMMRETEVKNYQYRFADEEIETDDADNNQTIAFDPIQDVELKPFGGLVEDISSSSGIKKEDDAFEEDELDLDEAISDFESIEDAQEIKKKLKKQSSTLSVKMLFTFLLSILPILTSLPFLAPLREMYAQTFIIAVTAITAVAALINIDIFKSFALVSKKAAYDLSLSLCTIASIGYGIYATLTESYFAEQFAAVSVLGMLFSLIGKKSNVKRILKNFQKISNTEEKFALSLIDETKGSYAIAQNAVEGEALIAVGKKTVNILGYLKNSYSKNPFGKANNTLSVIGIVVSLILSVYSFVIFDVASAFGVLVMLLSITAPLTVNLIHSLPLSLANKRLAQYGAMLSGYKAACEIEAVNAVAFDVQSIFPRGTVKMFDMKVLHPNDLERTIFNAAAVTTTINSPLGHVFRRIARTSDDYVLPLADSVKYEKRMGISGWVGDDSLLIGNRTLMETHGVSVPSVEVDKKILRNGYFPVYVASNGHPCALIIVGYEPDPKITRELQRLCNMGVTLLVNNCDPNITEEMLCDYFDLPNDFVKLMKSSGITEYENCTKPCDSLSSGASYDGSSSGLAAIVTAAIKVKKLTTAMTVLHTIAFVLGLAAAILLVITKSIALFTPLNALIYLAASLIFVCLAPLFYKP